MKPYKDFPLFPHDSGRWAKKIRGRLHYFGRWGRKQGNRYVRMSPTHKDPNKFAFVNTVATRFAPVLKRLKINGRNRLGFYTLRHNFETIAGDSKDQVAVDAIMGHVDNSMAARYREEIADDRLRAVVDHVHVWLFGTGEQDDDQTADQEKDQVADREDNE